MQLTRVDAPLGGPKCCPVSYTSLRRYVRRQGWTRPAATVRLPNPPPGQVGEQHLCPQLVRQFHDVGHYGFGDFGAVQGNKDTFKHSLPFSHHKALIGWDETNGQVTETLVEATMASSGWWA